jgi:3-oxoacyl-[acyl-carrier protein] reductase
MTEKIGSLFSLDGSVSIVTGGSRGIGSTISYRLAQAGSDVATVHAGEYSPTPLVRSIKRLGRRIVDIPGADVSEEISVKRAVNQVVTTLGRVDILVNNAGIYLHSLPEKTTAEEWDRVIGVNLRGAFLFSREVGRQMISAGRGGRIVNVASIDVYQPERDFAHYDASKAGLVGLTRSLALSWGRYGINVNAVAPGLVETPDLWKSARDRANAFRRFSPLGRIPRAEDVANLVLFLCSPASAMITGQVVIVDAGATLTGYMGVK